MHYLFTDKTYSDLFEYTDKRSLAYVKEKI